MLCDLLHMCCRGKTIIKCSGCSWSGRNYLVGKNDPLRCQVLYSGHLAHVRISVLFYRWVIKAEEEAGIVTTTWQVLSSHLNNTSVSEQCLVTSAVRPACVFKVTSCQWQGRGVATWGSSVPVSAPLSSITFSLRLHATSSH